MSAETSRLLYIRNETSGAGEGNRKGRGREERLLECMAGFFSVQFDVVCVAEEEPDQPRYTFTYVNPQRLRVNGILLVCWFWCNLVDVAEFHIHGPCEGA